MQIFPDPSDDVVTILVFDAVTNYIFRHDVAPLEELKAQLPSRIKESYICNDYATITNKNTPNQQG